MPRLSCFLPALALASTAPSAFSFSLFSFSPAPSSSAILHNGIRNNMSLNANAMTTTLDGQEIRGDITPLGNFILVKTKDTLAATGGGILLPDQSQERPTEGEVFSAGPGKLHPHTGVRITNPIGAGMSVLYGKFDGTPMTFNDEPMQMIRDDDVMLHYEGVKMSRGNVTPNRDYVLIKLDEQKLETDSGIVVAASVTKDDIPCVGTVFKVGEGRMCSTGEYSASPVSPGDRCKFKDYAGNEIKIDNEAYSLVRMVEILCSSSTKSE